MADITAPWLPFTLPEWLAVPALTLGFLIASVNVFLFHILAARPERSALYFWPFALGGFTAGHFVGLVLDVPLGMLGGTCIGSPGVSARGLILGPLQTQSDDP